MMSFEWSRPYPWWSYLLALLVAAAVLLLARRQAISPRLRSWSLFVPRILVLGLLLLLLMNPVRRSEQQLPSQPSTIAYVVDTSRSMALDEPISRLDQVKQIIQEARTTANDHPSVRVQLYHFGHDLAAAASVSQLSADDDATKLEDALAHLQVRFGTPPPRAVVVFSDGAVKSPFDPQVQANLYRQLKIPVHVYPVGNPDHLGDVAIEDLVVPRRAERGAKVTVRAVLRAQGFEGQRVVARVRAADRADRQPLVSLPLTLGEGQQPIELVFEHDPDVGELLLEIPALAGEAITRNNQVPFNVASTDRKLKVIYMEGTASNEYHWVQDALLEDKDIQCLSLVADHQYVQRPRLMRVNDSYKGYPATREELFEYDCVICSDISRGAFTPEQLEWTVELVAKRGGGFAMVGGITSFGAGGWDQTVWDQLIPVDMRGDQIGRGWLYHQFRMQIPAEAQNHPIWRITEDAAENQRALASIPVLYGTNFMQRLKPAATPLALSATPLPNVGIMPIMAAQPYGRGRTFAFASDTTADWGRDFESRWGPGDNRYFRRFWRNAVRWLTENSSAGSRRLQVDTDRIIYRPGQTIELSAVALDEALLETTNYELTARIKNAVDSQTPPMAITLQAAPDGKRYAGQLETRDLFPHTSEARETALAAREIEVVARHQQQEIARSTVVIQLLEDSAELQQPRAQPETLEQLAQAAGGQVLRRPAELAQLLTSMPTEKGEVLVSRDPVWDHPALWSIIFLLLCIEWVMRRMGSGGSWSAAPG